ncbi:MAG: ketopantoate reductase family protein [Panacagrimonas sp.]
MILVIGSGVVGTLIATHLVAAGRNVGLYTRPKDAVRFGAITQLRVDFAKPGKTPLLAPRPRLVMSLDLEGVEFALICVKYPDLDALVEQLPLVIPPGCTLISTLNGVAPLRRLRDARPHARLVPMSIMMNGQPVAPLHARLSTRAEIVIGSSDANLLAQFRGAGMQVKQAQGEAGVWGKLLINLANAICALTRSDFKALFRDPDLRSIYVAVLDETTAALDGAGIAWQLPLVVPYPAYRWMLLHGGPLPWWFARFRNGVRPGAFPSMVADIEAGRETEVDQLNGEIERLGQVYGLPTPINSGLAILIRARDCREPMSPARLRKRLQEGLA